MADDTLAPPKAPQMDPEAPLYRHTKRPEWGVALLVWERGERRGYQFEDGRLRKFQKGYYELLEEVDDFDGPAETVRANIERALGVPEVRTKPKVEKAVCTFQQQVDLFTRLYPGGFQDAAWISDHRGALEGSGLKRHHEPTVAKARELLSEERCDAMLSEGRHDDLVEAVTEVLASTSLVPLSHVQSLRAMDGEKRIRYARSVADLLHGERPFSARFGAWIEGLTYLLGTPPSWPVATALPALIDPAQHVSVRHSAFARQAGSVAPTALYSQRARMGSYKNFRRVAEGVKERLNAAGHEPRDMLDIHDFIWATLRSAALDQHGPAS